MHKLGCIINTLHDYQSCNVLIISLYSSRYAEFPQHVMQMIFELQPDKRELLLNIVSEKF